PVGRHRRRAVPEADGRGVVTRREPTSISGLPAGRSHVRAAPAQEDIRRLNLGAVLRHIHVSGAMSRADLTARLGLNRATIGALTVDLADAGLVSEGAPE